MDNFLTPVLVLIVWSLLIWCVMYARRIPAMNKAGIDPQEAAHPGSLNVLPSATRAAADNYNHLMEQPRYDGAPPCVGLCHFARSPQPCAGHSQ